MQSLPYVYIQSEPHLYTVGHYSPAGWLPESDHESADAAAKRVHYLNGGNDEELKAERDKLLDALIWMNGRLKLLQETASDTSSDIRNIRAVGDAAAKEAQS